MPLSRRDFLKGVGLAVGSLGLGPIGYERLIPYVDQPNDIVPGVSTWYATSCRECPAGCGMIVRNRDSHAVKCEGNKLHPISAGTLCARGQAALMGLYDPDRVNNPMRKAAGGFVDASWDEALKAVGGILKRKGRIAFISDLQTGSTEAIIRAWLKALGSDRLVVWEPIDYSAVKTAFGVVPKFDLTKSDYLVSFGADFLENWISPVEFARQFTVMRQVKAGRRTGFAYIGPRLTMTAANADIRIMAPPGAEVEVARAIATGDAAGVSAKYAIDPVQVTRIREDLHRSKSRLILPGWNPDSAGIVSILGGGASPAVDKSRPHAVSGIGGRGAIEALIGDMERGAVDVLVALNANPVYALPESARFKEALKRVGTVISLSSFTDETAALADWVLPSNTPLESWGDYQPYSDVRNLMQPVMGRVFDTRQTGDILIELVRAAGIDPVSAFKADTFYGFLRAQWGHPLAAGATADTPAPDWESLLERGGAWSAVQPAVIPSETAVMVSAPAAAPAPSHAAVAGPVGATGLLIAAEPEPSIHNVTADPGPWKLPSSTMAKTGFPPYEGGTEGGQLRLYAFPHIYLYDGRGANRRWLQEIPEPITRAVWGTWAEIHPWTARTLGIETDDVVEIEAGTQKVRLSAYVWDGVAPGTVAVPIGEGHTDYGRFASGVGQNVLALLGEPTPAVKISRTGDEKWQTRYKGSPYQWDREIVQNVGLGEQFGRKKPIIMPLPSGYKHWDFYPGNPYKKHRWAMVIDLNRCIGCHACVTACYAENNLAIVEPEGIYRRREMSWLRIDRYFDWREASNPVQFQPMLCQHCDAAPCEPVCPVFAASHSDEGLNMQIYNRCVGTRYCSNNCPYKVRRFNWWDYKWPEPLNWQLNPDVTVRKRGVMEKCTFCIQRIREVEIIAKREGRPVRDGEVIPACVQTCPTHVFAFGDLMDRTSEVSRLYAEEPRGYQVLAELNTKPAILYLKRIVG